jgi:WD40 repeat protein
VRDASSGRDLLVLQQDGTIDFTTFSRDGRYLVTGSDDGSARLWDAISGKELAILRGHNGPVMTAVPSPDGLKIVTASQDRTARIWDAASGTELAVLRHANDLYGARFSPDGQKVITFTHDATIVDGQSQRAALAKKDIDYDTIDNPVLTALAEEVINSNRVQLRTASLFDYGMRTMAASFWSCATRAASSTRNSAPTDARS